jgi:excisionase family DNA binding protein
MSDSTNEKMPDLKTLTTKEVARLCRVSDATVKRWEKAGVLKSERTNGGHRRFRVEEIARFQREQKLGLKQTHADDSAIKTVTRRKRVICDSSSSSLFHALIAGHEEESANLLITLFLRGEPLVKIFDGVVTEAMRRIGDLWLGGELTVAQEHLASRTILSAAQKLRAVVPVPEMTGKLAFVCAIENDFHELPAHLAQITLESAGWEVLNFGANMPLYSLMTEVLQQLPELVVVSATMINDIERTSRDCREFSGELLKRNIALAVGGRAFTDERIRRRFPANLYAESFCQLLDFASKI